MSISLAEKSLITCRAAVGKKAADLVLLDLRELSGITDFFLLCTGRSTRQTRAIAEAIEETLLANGVSPLSSEGHPEGRWILIDYDDLIVHIFTEETRRFYDLEHLWARAPRLPSLDGKPIPQDGETPEPAKRRAGAEG